MCVCVFQVNFITCQTGRRSRVVTQDWRNLFYLGLDVSRIVDMTCLCDPIGPFFLLLLLLIHLEVLLWLIKYQPRPHSPEVQSSSRALFPWFSLSPSISRPVHQTACPSRGKRAGESVFFSPSPVCCFFRIPPFNWRLLATIFPIFCQMIHDSSETRRFCLFQLTHQRQRIVLHNTQQLQ